VGFARLISREEPKHSKPEPRTEEKHMYVGGGVVALAVLILLVILLV
jgi:hypothetical protein